MRLRPLGWELTVFLVAFNVLAVGLATGYEPFVIASVVAMGLAAPVVLVSLFVRLAAGVADEYRRAS